MASMRLRNFRTVPRNFRTVPRNFRTVPRNFRTVPRNFRSHAPAVVADCALVDAAGAGDLPVSPARVGAQDLPSDPAAGMGAERQAVVGVGGCRGQQ